MRSFGAGRRGARCVGLILGWAWVGVLGLTGCGSQPAEPTAHSLEDLTGVHTRVVWIRQVVNNGNDPMGFAPDFVLMGLDSRDPGGERILLDGPASYRKPLMSPDGGWVVFTDMTGPMVQVVSWEGLDRKDLVEGLAVEVWRDPATALTWVYYLAELRDNQTADGFPLRRCRLDQPGVDELVYEAGDVTPDSWQLSADGRRAAGLFPWSRAGILDLASSTVTTRGKGCWTGFAPDNSYLMWIFDGPHKNLLLKPDGSLFTRKIRLNTAPGTEGHEVYHPRWSNHVRFLAMTGPYTVQGQYNAVHQGGSNIHVYVGRFREDFKQIEAWTQVTRAGLADFFPDVWLAGGETSTASGLQVEPEVVVPPVADWPGVTNGLVYVWENARGLNEVRPGAGRPVEGATVKRGRATLGPHYQADLAGGRLETGSAGEAIAAACAASGAFTLEVVVQLTDGPRPGWGVIATQGRGATWANFHLAEKRGRLFFLMAREGYSEEQVQPWDLFAIQPGRPHHVVVSYRDGALSWYCDGEALAVMGDVSGGLAAWQPDPLVLGSAADGSLDWSGSVEFVAIYDRALEAGEVKAHFGAVATVLKERRPIPILTVKARLTEKTETPTPASIAPYRDGLMEYIYDVEQVVAGACEADQVNVKHWAILDGEVMAEERTVGEIYVLSLESVDDHPELEGERVSSTVDPTVIDLYLDVTGR